MQSIENCLPNDGKRAQAMLDLDHGSLTDLGFRCYRPLAQPEGSAACSCFRNVWHATSYQM